MIGRQIDADIMMVRVLQGEEVGFDEFSLSTIGFIPERAPRSRINGLIARLGDLTLEHSGFRYEDDPNRYRDEYKLRDSLSIKRAYTRGIAMTRAVVSRYVQWPDEELDFKFQNLPEKNWSASVATDEDGNFTAIANVNPGRGWTRGRAWLMPFHEIGGHYVQAKQWQQAIREGHMDPALGLTAFTSPETAYLEIIASAAEMLMLKGVDTEEERVIAEIQLCNEELKNAALHNAHVQINHGHAEQAVLAEAVELLPLMDPVTIKRAIQNGRNNPMDRANQSVYYPARELVRPLMSIDDPEILKSALGTMYSSSLTYQEVRELVMEALE